MKTVPLFHWLTLISYFCLMLTLLGWILLAPHTANYPTAAMLVLGVVPLLFPMRGLLYARPYTHAWTSFLMLFYFSHAVGEVYSAGGLSPWAWLALVFSTVCFCCCIIFVKVHAKARHASQK